MLYAGNCAAGNEVRYKYVLMCNNEISRNAKMSYEKRKVFLVLYAAVANM